MIPQPITEQIKIGDTVRLKSGGPDMRVIRLTETKAYSSGNLHALATKYAICKWHDGDAWTKDYFHIKTLEKTYAPQKSI
jgi:uncharacterized protein YodC (DUF2158 family)